MLWVNGLQGPTETVKLFSGEDYADDGTRDEYDEFVVIFRPKYT